VELLTFAVTAGSLAVSDQAPTWRPVSPLARAGLPEGAVARAPLYVKVEMSPEGRAREVLDANADFRDELSIPRRGRPVVLDVRVSGSEKSLPPLVPSVFSTWVNRHEWTHVARIHLDQSIRSEGCDAFLHFPHTRAPKSARGWTAKEFADLLYWLYRSLGSDAE
jgi:hypothetical protein